MRYFFRSRIPEPRRVLLVESGSRWILEKAYTRMRDIFPQSRFDLCTCFPGEPAPGAFEHVFRVTDAPGVFSKLKLARAVRRLGPSIAAFVFSGEAILLRWKFLFMALLPAKLVVINENGDFFWLDWSNRATLRQFLASRISVDGHQLLRATCRLLLFPLVFLFLTGSALLVYLVRWTRLLSWRLGRRDQTKG